MYHGFWDAVAGFSKSVFAVFEYHVLFYLLVWGWVGLAFLEPVLVLLYRAAGVDWPVPFPQPLAVLAVVLALALWAIAYRRFGFPAYLLPLYPVSLILFTLVAMRSMVLTMTGHATWKGRVLEKPAWRL